MTVQNDNENRLGHCRITKTDFQHSTCPGARSRQVSPPASPLFSILPPFRPSALLLIILDDLRRANFRLIRIKPDVAKGASLTQEIPALIQFDPDLHEPLPVGFGMGPELMQSVFFFDQALNVIEDRLIFDLILHKSLLQRGCGRYEYVLIVRPHHPSVN